MSQPLAPKSPRAIEIDPRDVARRVVALTTATTGLVGILAGRPLIAVIVRAGTVCGGGILVVVAAEAIVRRAKRRIVR